MGDRRIGDVAVSQKTHPEVDHRPKVGSTGCQMLDHYHEMHHCHHQSQCPLHNNHCWGIIISPVLKYAIFCKFLVDKFEKKDMLEKKFCSNIVPSARTGSHFFYTVKYNGWFYKNRFLAITFDWIHSMECPNKVISTQISYILSVFSGIPYLPIFFVPPATCHLATWPPGHLPPGHLKCKNHRRVGYPWKEHSKCSLKIVG